jgi:hypothetical protein
LFGLSTQTYLKWQLSSAPDAARLRRQAPTQMMLTRRQLLHSIAVLGAGGTLAGYSSTAEDPAMKNIEQAMQRLIDREEIKNYGALLPASRPARRGRPGRVFHGRLRRRVCARVDRPARAQQAGVAWLPAGILPQLSQQHALHHERRARL